METEPIRADEERAAIRRARWLCLAGLAVLLGGLLVLPAPWNVPGGPGITPPADRAFSDTVAVALFWAAAVNALLLAAAWATARLWARPLRARLPERGPRPGRVGRGFVLSLLAAAALAGALRWPLAHGSLWWDEGWSLTRVVRGWVEPSPADPRVAELEERHWARTIWYWKKPTNHVLYNVSARATLDAWRWLGHHDAAEFDEFVFRLPAFTASLAAVIGIGLLGWRFGFPAAGVAAAFLLALQPWGLRYSVDGRAYAFVVPLTIACMLALTEALRGGAWRWWILYGAAQLLLLWTHPFMIYLTAGLGAGALGSLVLRRDVAPRDRTTGVLRLVVANAGAALALLQVMAPNLAQALVWDDEARGTGLSLTTAVQLWSFMTTGLPLAASGGGPGDPPYPSLRAWAATSAALRPVVFGLLPALALLGAGRLLARRGPARVVWSACALTVPLCMGIVHLTKQLYYDRFMTFGLPPLLLALAIGATTVLGGLPARPRLRRPIVAGGLALGVAAWVLLVSPQLHVVLTRPIAPLREVGEFLRARAGDDPLSVLRAGYGLGGGMPRIYDPWIRYLDSPRGLARLCAQARREGRPLYVFFGQESFNRERSPEGFALLDDRTLFEPQATFAGVEPRFVYHVLRYTGAPLPLADGSGTRATEAR